MGKPSKTLTRTVRPATRKIKKSTKGASTPLLNIQAPGLESVAVQISVRIRELHMPYGTIMDPVFAAPESGSIVSYTRTGDSAIWTGHYLAAEAFRFATTGNSDALANVAGAIAGIRGLVDITGNDVLARVAIPTDSPYAAAIQKEEGGHGVFPGRLHGRECFWIGNTTRDQYSGALFGLGVALDLVRDASVQRDVKDLFGGAFERFCG